MSSTTTPQPIANGTPLGSTGSAPDLLTPAELSGELRIPLATLAQWRYRREGPAYVRAGKHVRYQRSAVEAWLTRETRPTS